MALKMKLNSTMIALGGAAFAGILAVVLATCSFTPSDDKQEFKIAQAATILEAGQNIAPADVKTVVWPKDKIPNGAILDAASLTGRVVKTKINPDQVILESMLVSNVSGPNLSSDIPAGKRAFTIGINEISGVGGFASPGNYVDVMLSTKDAAGQPISKIVVKRVRVMAVAQARSYEDNNPKLGSTITLEVTPQEAQILDVSRYLGSLSLVLRNRQDDKDPNNALSSKSDLMLSPNISSDSGSVEIIRGNMAGAGYDSSPNNNPNR